MTVKMSLLLALLLLSLLQQCCGMSQDEKNQLKEETRDMFYHAYNAYMSNAYPADELMPLSCKGRVRGQAEERGDIDDVLGNFSLTLIDTLDTLVILGDLEEFEHAVQLVIKDVTFDQDVVVSVFETNIRVLGGLLSSHVLSEYIQSNYNYMPWYKGELLQMATDLGYRLLPAFNSTTGIPYARVNLRHGMTSTLLTYVDTCTACAGTSILELATLSRLTGIATFEQVAHRSMDVLWGLRGRGSDLMGSVLDVEKGEWKGKDSGVGAGGDSYYEYCLKAYILLGIDKYLHRFERHYAAIMKYINKGSLLVNVHMHRPYMNSRGFVDALMAFWPGLQVLKGDLPPAISTHELLYQLVQKHNFLPEAFTNDFQVHWKQHPLRPEFIESTYFLYTATGDPYYLNVGKFVLQQLQKYARVPCGYAAVADVRTGLKEDRLDSFFFAETLKYLYLLFAESDDLLIDLHQFLFTTEAHLVPLSIGNNTSNTDSEVTTAPMCPTTATLLPAEHRHPLKNIMATCPKRVTGVQFIQGIPGVQVVSYTVNGVLQMLLAGPAHFASNVPTTASLVVPMPYTACSVPSNQIKGKIALVLRGDCTFVQKARNVQKSGGVGVIVIDNEAGNSNNQLFAMSGDGINDVTIPTVFLLGSEAQKLLGAFHTEVNLMVNIGRELIKEVKVEETILQKQTTDDLIITTEAKEKDEL